MFRFTILAVAFVAASTAFVATLPSDEPHKPAVTEEQLKDAPLTIAATTFGRFAEGSSWHISVNSARQAELTIQTFPNRARKQFELTQEQMDQFRSALVQQRFFELASDYGQRVPDSSIKTLTVTAGRHSNSVKVQYLTNWLKTDKAKLSEPSRAVHLLVMIRSWFDDAEAVDLRKYDRMVLDAVK